MRIILILMYYVAYIMINLLSYCYTGQSCNTVNEQLMIQRENERVFA